MVYQVKGQVPLAQLLLAGHAPVLQDGGANVSAPDDLALNVENCFSNFLEPHLGHVGFWLPVTKSSTCAPQALHTYSKRGISF